MLCAMELLGRERELETFAAYADAVREGPVGFVVEGEPGIGKTTLWQAAVAAARERGYCVLTCRPAGSEVQLSFAALGDLLEDVLDETLTELPRPQRRALEVALLLEDPQGLPPDQRRSVSPSWALSASSQPHVPCWSPSTTFSGWTVRVPQCSSSRFAGCAASRSVCSPR
jgi:Predicted ATPase